MKHSGISGYNRNSLVDQSNCKKMFRMLICALIGLHSFHGIESNITRPLKNAPIGSQSCQLWQTLVYGSLLSSLFGWVGSSFPQFKGCSFSHSKFTFKQQPSAIPNRVATFQGWHTSWGTTVINSRGPNNFHECNNPSLKVKDLSGSFGILSDYYAYHKKYSGQSRAHLQVSTEWVSFQTSEGHCENAAHMITSSRSTDCYGACTTNY